MLRRGVTSGLGIVSPISASKARRAISTSAPNVSKDGIAALVARIEALERDVKKLEMKKMPTTQLGAIDFEASKISLGCAPLGGVYGDMPQAEAQSIIDMCLAAGVNLFDTSPYYGNTTSEKVLGECLKNSPFERDSYFIATKCGRYVDEGSDFSAKRIEQSIEESLNRLQVDCIDLVQCHDVEFARSMQEVVEEALPVLDEARAAGKIRHVGISGLPLSVLDFVLEHSDVEIDTILTYCNYTLQNENLKQFVPRWAHRKLGIIQGGAMSMGLLSPQGLKIGTLHQTL